MLDYLKRHPKAWIVLATHQRTGAARWLSREVAAPLTQEAALPALFVPPDTSGFVDAASGVSRIRRILVPIDRHPHPNPTLAVLPDLTAVFQDEAAEAQLLHVGDAASMPRVQLPVSERWTWTPRTLSGPVVQTILETETSWQPDLIVMTTKGRQGFLEALFGSTTEQVVRRARCPVLTFPTRQ